MRGAPAKWKEPTRQTRSGVAGKMVAGPKAGASLRPKRAAVKPKAKPTKPKKKPPTPAEKKPPKPTKAAPKKTSNKQKEKQIKDDEMPNAEPVEVVIHVKKQRSKKKTEPAKMGVAAGKVGKRKGRQGKVKKETLKKASKSADKDDVVVKVAVVKKVLPSPRAETKRKEKPAKKEKQEKKKDENKKEKEEKIKKEPKEGKKEMKLEKKIKEEPIVIDEKKDIKDEKAFKPEKHIKDGNIIKEEKGVKDEKVVKEEKLAKEEKIIKQEKGIKEEKNAKEEKITEAKKKPKPKNKSKETKDSKKVEESKSKEEVKPEIVKPTKTKVKLEKVSPITVQDDNELDFPTCPTPPMPKNSRNPSPVKGKAGRNAKQPKQPEQKKEKVLKKRPGRKPAVKAIKEEPIFHEKRHREASLNALAKVHCLYENESRGAMNEMLDKGFIVKRKEIKVEKDDPSDNNGEDEEPEVEEKPSRTLRSAPGMRGMGRHWDILNAMSTSSSSDDEIEKVDEESSKDEAEEENEGDDEEEQPKEEEKPVEKKTRKSRKRTELMMDLKDMVVRKRMASLNASAMMAASYSVERRGSGDKRRSGRSSDDSTSSAVGDSSDDEVIVSGTSKKVAVIVNQDTDLTITGLYTTRSTRHEGYCSIAGMQYRISSTSHTQTEATAVSTETVIHTTDHVSVSHSESGGSVEAGGTSSPGGSCKSYTPLGALSSMQPPGQGRPCGSSAFSAPPYHPHPQDLHEFAEDYEPKYCPPERARNFLGYYQPAGPLISHGGGPTSASGTTSTSKSATPEPYPPHPYPSYPAYDYPGYYGRGYRRPWASTSQMMTDYLEPTYPPPHPSYYHYPPPPPPTAAPPAPPLCYTGALVRPPFMDTAAFQCPCPMQSSCPKNVLTGPLTGASKRSEPEAQTSELTTLLPVALALPPEPTGASPGPPSPARGSAGMPPPASPALSTARNNRWSPPEAGLIKAVTPPPPITVVESPPPTIATPPPQEPPPPCKRSNKRAASDTIEGVRKRKKSSLTGAKQNKNKGSKTSILEKIEENNEHNNNNITRNCKVSELPLRRAPSLRWSNGWFWEGEPYTAKVFLTTENQGVMRTCYPAMRHREGDVIKPRDCILLKSSGPRKALPFVAKVSAMWENPGDHEMMVSVLWYYRPEHTDQGRTDDQPIDEIFASRHKDTNSVACIEDKCYVLTFHEYCRYRKSLIAGGRKMNTVVPPPSEGYPRADQLPPGQVASDLVFFCRQVYDFRQKKILKKPPSQSSSRT